MAVSKLTSLAEEKRSTGYKTMSRDSIGWLRDKIEEIKRPDRIPPAINAEKLRRTTAFRVGMMYCFFYDPKTKADFGVGISSGQIIAFCKTMIGMNIDIGEFLF